MSATKRPHPHFDDRGTLDWHSRFDSAQAQAKNEKKLLFIEFGREQCSNCRTLVQNAVPHGEVAPILARHFIALASDCDDAEDAVQDLSERLPDATMLPFLLLADSEGRFLVGSEGAQGPRALKELLLRAIEVARDEN